MSSDQFIKDFLRATGLMTSEELEASDNLEVVENVTVINNHIDTQIEKALGLTHEEWVLAAAIADALACQELSKEFSIEADMDTQNAVRRLERFAGSSSFSFHGVDYRITTDDAGNKTLVRLDSESE